MVASASISADSAAEQFVAGERGIAPFATSLVRRGFACHRPRHLNSNVMRLFWLTGVLGLILIVACVSRHRTADRVPASAEQRPDASTLVPADLAFAKPFVQLLLDGGWTVQPV